MPVLWLGVESAQWAFAASALIALGSLAGIWINSRGTRDATEVESAAQTVEARSKEFAIMTATLDAVVKDQERQREETDRLRVGIAACIAERAVARENNRRLLDWIRERHPGEPVPDLLDVDQADDLLG